jgi:hypothetical protein
MEVRGHLHAVPPGQEPPRGWVRIRTNLAAKKKQKNLLLRGTEHRFLGCPACSLAVTSQNKRTLTREKI